jgi:hypothetical protein
VAHWKRLAGQRHGDDRQLIHRHGLFAADVDRSAVFGAVTRAGQTGLGRVYTVSGRTGSDGESLRHSRRCSRSCATEYHHPTSRMLRSTTAPCDRTPPTMGKSLARKGQRGDIAPVRAHVLRAMHLQTCFLCQYCASSTDKRATNTMRAVNVVQATDAALEAKVTLVVKTQLLGVQLFHSVCVLHEEIGSVIPRRSTRQRTSHIRAFELATRDLH